MWNLRNEWLGVALIALGVAFFAGSYFGYDLRNWWALFILIPAVGAFGTAWYSWKAGRMATATSQLTLGLVLASVAAIFLVGMPWRLAWPALFIVAGLGLLLPRLASGRVP
jgi:putative effector of murein hydrolase